MALQGCKKPWRPYFYFRWICWHD